MKLEARTRLDASPDEVFQFFENMETHYELWHPDHITFRWITEGGLRTGAEAYFEERIAGKLQTKTVRFTRVIPGKLIEFRPTGWVTRLLLPRIRFTIDSHGDGSEVVQQITVRTGPIGAWLNRREFDAVRTHMREEGEHLRRVLTSQVGEST